MILLSVPCYAIAMGQIKMDSEEGEQFDDDHVMPTVCDGVKLQS